jgi:hypothetical protein
MSDAFTVFGDELGATLRVKLDEWVDQDEALGAGCDLTMTKAVAPPHECPMRVWMAAVRAWQAAATCWQHGGCRGSRLDCFRRDQAYRMP